jgi:hypothetical protein
MLLLFKIFPDTFQLNNLKFKNPVCLKLTGRGLCFVMSINFNSIELSGSNNSR